MAKKTNKPFAKYASQFWEKGLSALPVVKGTKQPTVPKWSGYQANLPNEKRRQEWLNKYADDGIGINTGTEILPGEILVGIDVDDDRLVRVTAALLGVPTCAKRGKKGATFFARMAKPKKSASTTLKGGEGLGDIDILAGGRFSVLPPTVHPDTKQPYEWIIGDLLTVAFPDLPAFDQNTQALLKVVIGSDHTAAIASGEATHEPGVRLAAELVSFGASDAQIETIFSNLLPKNYTGNSLEELSGWIQSARAKGFDQFSGYGEYDPGDTGPIPLGYSKEGNFALRDQIRGIVLIMSPNQLLNYQTLVGLAPTQFWAAQFPSEKSMFSAMGAGEALIQACRDKGPFDPIKVRGRGVWSSKGDIVLNLGDDLPDDLQHQYLCFSPVPVEACEEFEAKRLHELIQQFNFRDQGNAAMLYGWLSIALIGGALDWRPHGFIFGPPNTGKTTLHNLIAALLTPMVVAADGQSTEAGIRQRLGPDALPVLLDEFETDAEARRLQSVLRLARSASSAESPLLRGTPEGKAMQFSIRASFMFSAVNVTGMTPADQTRILTMELCPHNSDPETGTKIEAELAHFRTLGPRWCGYVVGLAETILQAISVFSAAMPGYDSRLRKTFATLMSGVFVTLHRRVPTSSEAEQMVDEYRQTIEGHQRDQERDNAQECLTHLLSHIERAHDAGENTVGYWLARELQRIRSGARPNTITESKRITDNLQAKFHIGKGQDGLLIRNGSEAVDRVYAGTRWANGAWNRALGQLSGAFRLERPERFPNIPGKHRCLGIPLHYLPELDDEDDGDGDVSF